MSWTSLIFFGLTLVALRFMRTQSDEVIRFLSSLIAVACLVVGLATASVLLKSLMILGLLLTNPAIRHNRNFG